MITEIGITAKVVNRSRGSIVLYDTIIDKLIAMANKEEIAS